MPSETLFLQPTEPTADPNPNFAEASGNSRFFNYSQSASGSLTSTEAKALVDGGITRAIAEAGAIFINAPAFAELFTKSSGEGEEGTFNIESRSETKVVANFEVEANQTFSFDFAADLDLEAKEIENPYAEFNKAGSITAFLVLEISNVARPKILDFFGLGGSLIPSLKIGGAISGSSRNVTVTTFSDTDINGNNGTDFVTSFSNGTYQRIFSNDTQLAIAAINASATKLFGDTLIGKLGNDVRYGSIWSDYLRGTIRGDKMYGSAGNDILDGNRGDDILEGGGGKDRLFGHLGNDKLHGGSGDDTLRGSSDNDTLVGGDDNDYLVGGYGSDVMTGNGGEDKFVYEGYINLLPGEFDIIKDFEVSKDKLVLKGWDDFDADQLFSDAVSQGLITNTENGALLNPGIGGQLLFENVDISALSGSDFILA